MTPVLNDALHSTRSLLCTATNETPHERFFKYARRSSNATTQLAWLAATRPVLLCKFNRSARQDGLLEEVDLFEAYPSYAYIRYKDGRETTVTTPISSRVTGFTPKFCAWTNRV